MKLKDVDKGHIFLAPVGFKNQRGEFMRLSKTMDHDKRKCNCINTAWWEPAYLDPDTEVEVIGKAALAK